MVHKRCFSVQHCEHSCIYVPYRQYSRSDFVVIAVNQNSFLLQLLEL